MSIINNNEILALSDYIDSEEMFLLKLRLDLEWDEAEFEKMITIAEQSLKVWNRHECIPGVIVFFFFRIVEDILSITSRNEFYLEPPDPHSSSSYKDLIDKGCQKLIRMRENFILNI